MLPRPSTSRPRPCVLAGIALLCAAGASADDAGPVPHTARYQLSLHRSALGGEVAAVKGRLEMRLEQSCDGWRAEQSLGFRMLTQGGDSLEHVVLTSGFEERDGSSFVFSTEAWEDRELAEQLSGVARREAGRAHVRYARPEAVDEPLPAATIFPERHLEDLLSAARAGARSVVRTVFDGSTRDNPFEVSAWIGRAREAGADAPAGLAGLTVWPVRLAYFPVDAVEPQADFEMSVQLYANGAAGDMVYDYGDFAIDVRLLEFERLPAPVCP